MNNEQHNKPWLIMVSGAPGSGKSTLVKKLVEKVQLMHVDPDVVLQNFWLSNLQNKEYDRETVGIPKFYNLLERILDDFGISIITDLALYKGKSEHYIARLKQHSQLINIHCRANNELGRFYKRETTPHGIEPDWLAQHKQVLEKEHPLVVDPLELGCPLIEVDTNDEYMPSIDEIIAKVNIPDGFKL